MNNVMKKRISFMVVVILLLSVIVGIIPAEQVQAASLSKKEKKYYSKILKDQQYLEDTEHSIYGNASFLLYDINNDGRKELIVGGPLGLRCAFFSIIYSYDGKKFHKTQTINGEVSAVSKNGIAFTYDDYSHAGMERYQSVTTYKLSSKGKLTQKLIENWEGRFVGNSDKIKTVKHNYHRTSNNKEAKISRKTYNKEYKKYKFKTAGQNYSYKENGKTISRKYDIQLHPVSKKISKNM